MGKCLGCVSTEGSGGEMVWESEDELTEGLGLSNLGTGKWCPWRAQLLYSMHSRTFSTSKSHPNLLKRQLSD